MTWKNSANNKSMQGIMGKFLEGQTGLSSPEIPSDCSEDPRLSRDTREEGAGGKNLDCQVVGREPRPGPGAGP